MKAILLAAGLSLFLALIGTRYAITLLTQRGYGQLIHKDLSTSHQTKRGTPTMGGLVIILASVVGYAVAKVYSGNLPSASALLILFLFVGLGTVGFLDDFIKLYKQRNLGLRAKAKFIGQTLVAVVFTVLSFLPALADERGLTPASAAVSFLRDTPLVLPVALAGILVIVMIAGASNGVNLSDGLDGLAVGSATMVFGAYALMNIWQNNQSCATNPSNACYEVRDPLDLAIIAASITGACFGFLWWNASPAQIFMGDTGSLALGGAMAGLAVFTRTELLLVLLGGLYVMMTLSVMLQVGWFKATKGKRLFRMTPLHHHFELLGWHEVTIVIRFWILTGLSVAAGLGIFYAEWVAGS